MIEVLQSFPLYRKLKCTLSRQIEDFPNPPVNMNCTACKGIRTFNTKVSVAQMMSSTRHQDSDHTITLEYFCGDCKAYRHEFFLRVAGDLTWMMKIGQFPAWDVKGDHDTEAMLGSHKVLLQRGLVSESQSYGIGAFAYYRRIVEEIIDQLLIDIGDMLDDDQKSAFGTALAEVKKTRVAAEKIALVKELLPQSLRPDGMNPLALLHRVLSEGLHADTDEKCMESATHVRNILAFLASRVAANKETGKAFTASMQSLLTKRSEVK